jgi:hypothetical protein
MRIKVARLVGLSCAAAIALLVPGDPVQASLHCSGSPGHFSDQTPINGQGPAVVWDGGKFVCSSANCVIGYVDCSWDCVWNEGSQTYVVANANCAPSYCGTQPVCCATGACCRVGYGPEPEDPESPAAVPRRQSKALCDPD